MTLKCGVSSSVIGQAVRARHQPGSEGEAEAARRRLAFEECLVLQLGLLLQRTSLQCAALCLPALPCTDVPLSLSKQRAGSKPSP